MFVSIRTYVRSGIKTNRIVKSWNKTTKNDIKTRETTFWFFTHTYHMATNTFHHHKHPSSALSTSTATLLSPQPDSGDITAALTRMETMMHGAPQCGGGLLARLQSLEEDVHGEVQSGGMPPRVAALQALLEPSFTTTKVPDDNGDLYPTAEVAVEEPAPDPGVAVTLWLAPAGDEEQSVAQIEVALKVDQAHAGVAVARRHSFVVVADRSASMRGEAWTQVQGAVRSIEDYVSAMEGDVQVKLVTYNEAAEVVTPAGLQMAQAQGRTNFAAAFQCVEKQLRSAAEGTDTATVLFMTDGQDTCGRNWDKSMVRLQACLREQFEASTVHAMGFTRHHDFQLLTKVTQLGHADGVFRYVEAVGHGEAVLQGALQEIFGLFAHEAACVPVGVTLPEGSLAFGGTVPSQTGSFDMSVCTDSSMGYFVTPVKIINGDDDDNEADLSSTMVMIDALGHCLPTSLLVRRPVDKSEIHAWRLVNLRESVSVTLDEIGGALKASMSSDDAIKWSDKLRGLQATLKTLRESCFGIKGNKATRQKALDELEVIQTQLDGTLSLVAEASRSRCAASVDVLARANDIKHAGRFGKAGMGRERRMNNREVRNAKELEDLDDKLRALVVDMRSLHRQLNASSIALYKCMMSQNDVGDLFEDPDCITEVLGFGLAVQRPQCAVDAPTEIRVHELGGTVLTKSAVEDAIKYGIDIGGVLVEFTRGDELCSRDEASLGDSAPLSGLSMEPINAWLPLYICPGHWQRVRLLLRPTLGYYCTLNPLGYDKGQVQAALVVLAEMVMRLATDEASDVLAAITFSWWRTCRAIVVELDQGPALRDMIHGFIREGPAGRNKTAVPSLHAMLGAAIVLGPDGCDCDTAAFRLGVVGELLRRGADVVMRGAPPALTTGILAAVTGCPCDGLLVPTVEGGGRQYKLASEFAMVADSALQEAGMAAMEKELPMPSDKLKQAMQLIGKEAAGRLPGGSMNKLTIAKRLVKAYAIETLQDIGEKPPMKVSQESAEAATRALAGIFSRAFHPGVKGLRVLLDALHWFRHAEGVGKISIAELDTASGVPQQHWVDELRAVCGQERLSDLPFTLANMAPTATVYNWKERRDCSKRGTDLAQYVVGAAAKWNSNGDFREHAATQGWREPSKDGAAYEAVTAWTKEAEGNHTEQWRRVENDVRMQRANLVTTTATTSMFEFIGSVAWFHNSERGQHFNNLLEQLVDPELDVPLREEKIKTALLGTLTDNDVDIPVIDRGNAFIPSTAVLEKIKAALGEEAWLVLETKLRVMEDEHKYRCACSEETGAACHQKNRHGSCNAKPGVMKNQPKKAK